MKKNIYLIVSLFILISCSSNKARFPSSGVQSILNVIESIEADIDRQFTSTLECNEVLKSYYETILTTNVDITELKAMSDDELIKRSKQTFNLRIKMQDRLKELTYEGRNYNECLDEIKHTLLALRYIDDFFIEEFYSRKQNFKKISKLNQTGLSPQLLVNSKFSDFKDYKDLKTGDVILTRGAALASAAIARIGRRDYQFSHLSLVYRDGDKIYTIESHVELGLKVAPISVHVKTNNARSVVFRFKDQELAARAAKMMYNHAKSRLKKEKYIAYDFTMNFREHSNYFCSEVIHQAFKMASNDSVEVPFFRTYVNAGLIPFLKNIGLPINEENVDKFDLFAPADIQVDARFEIVAEWRNPLILEDIRFRDSILSNVFSLMEKKAYKIDLNKNIMKTVKLGTFLRGTFPTSLIMYKKMPKDMEPKTMGTFIAIDKIGKSFEIALKEKTKEVGRRLSFIEIYEEIEKHNVKDLNEWKSGKFPKSNFHQYFRPDNL